MQLYTSPLCWSFGKRAGPWRHDVAFGLFTVWAWRGRWWHKTFTLSTHWITAPLGSRNTRTMPRRCENILWQPRALGRLGKTLGADFQRPAMMELPPISEHGAAWRASEPTMLMLAQLPSSLSDSGVSAEEEPSINVLSLNLCHWLHNWQLRVRCGCQKGERYVSA